MSTNLKKILKLDDRINTIPSPTIFLETKAGKRLGKINKFTNWNFNIVGNGLDEISFDVHKYSDGILCPIWDDIIDLKNVLVDEYGRFEVQVEYADEAETIKSVHGVSLETEFGQRYLFEFHVNDSDVTSITEDEIKKTSVDWKWVSDGEEKGHWEFIPTVFYNKDDEDHSLLHRVIKDKMPHWSIDDDKMTKWVTTSKDEEADLVTVFNREYTVDGTSIYDFLNSDVATQTNCIFRFDTIERKFWAEPLEDCYAGWWYKKNGTTWTTGEYDELGRKIEDKTLPRELVQHSIGEDTTVFVSNNMLSKSINITSNKDSVKNCYRINGGDDIITNLVPAANINGSSYIYQFADFQYNDMPEELANKLKSYQQLILDGEDNYNDIYLRLCTAYQELSNLQSVMAPNVEVADPITTAKRQWELLKTEMTNMIVGVQNVKTWKEDKHAGVDNNIESLAEILCSSNFKVEIDKDSVTYQYPKDGDNTKGHWKGVIVITKTSDETNYYPQKNENDEYPSDVYFSFDVKEDDVNKFYPTVPSTADIEVYKEKYPFTYQKILKTLSSGDMLITDLALDTTKTSEEILEILNKYALSYLDGFVTGFDSCLSILMSLDFEGGEPLYNLYKQRYELAKSVQAERQLQVKEKEELIASIQEEQREFQKSVDFASYLGEDLYKIFQRYIREENYTNSNFISDGYEDEYNKLLEKAKDLIDYAKTEIKKSCVLQRTANVSLNNIFMLPEFENLWSHFDLYNYIRVRTDDELLKMRIIGVSVNGDSLSDISVTFSDEIESLDGTTSDLKSILDQASAIATSYDATTLQANSAYKVSGSISNMLEEGLNATKTLLSNNDNNEITITQAGIIAKRMDDEGLYGDKQLRITGNGMYLTDDSWDTIRMGVGEIIYDDPITKQKEKKYGLLADAIVGKLIVGENMYIGDNTGNVQIDSSGITINKGTINWSDEQGVSSVNAPSVDDIKTKDDQTLSNVLAIIDDDISNLDGRLQTFVQETEPNLSEGWVASDHDGDLWVFTGTNTTNYKNGCTYIYDANTNSWNLTTDSSLKQLAESKAQIFTKIPTEPYYVGDLLIPTSDITFDEVTYKSKKCYKYNGTSWVEIDYTDDTTALKAVEASYVTPAEKLELNNTITDIVQQHISYYSIYAESCAEYDNYLNYYNKLCSLIGVWEQSGILEDPNSVYTFKGDEKNNYIVYFNKFYEYKRNIDAELQNNTNSNIFGLANSLGITKTSIGKDEVISPKISAGIIKSSEIYSYITSYDKLPIDSTTGENYYSGSYNYDTYMYGEKIGTGVGTFTIYYNSSVKGIRTDISDRNTYDLAGIKYYVYLSSSKDELITPQTTKAKHFQSYQYYNDDIGEFSSSSYNMFVVDNDINKYYLGNKLDDVGIDPEAGEGYYRVYECINSNYYLFFWIDTLEPIGGVEYVYDYNAIFSSVLNDLMKETKTPNVEINKTNFKLGDNRLKYSFLDNTLTIDANNFSLDEVGNIEVKNATLYQMHINGAIYSSNPQYYLNPEKYKEYSLFSVIGNSTSSEGRYAPCLSIYTPWLNNPNDSKGNLIIYGNADDGFTFYGKSTNPSDIRLKDNIINSEVTNALNLIENIQMYSFDWKKDNKHQKIGFVADELEKLDKDLVFGGGCFEDGTINTKSVDSFYLQGYIVKAIQELSQQNKSLKQEIKELKEKLDG